MNRFMTGLSKLVEKEFCMEILVDDMDISCIMVFSQQMEDSKLKKETVREKKRSWVKNDGSDGHGRSKNRQKFSRKGFYDGPNKKHDRVSTPRYH